jgi:SpoVK/Ycf46/Vps4 family AAA+-type ATPase
MAEPAFPEWIQQLREYYQQGVVHQFILDFNINDFMLWPQGDRMLPRGLKAFLQRYLTEQLGYQIVLFYSQSAGITTLDEASLQGFAQAIRGAESEGAAAPHVPQVTLEGLLTQVDRHVRPQAQARDVFPLLDQLVRQRQYRVALVLEYLEKLAPNEPAGASSEPHNVEMLQRWALDMAIGQARNMVIGLTNNLGHVDPSLHAPDSGCEAIRISLPGDSERATYFRYLQSQTDYRLGKLAHLSDALGETEEQCFLTLVTLTKGFRLRDCDALNRLALAQPDRTITVTQIKELKAKLIGSGSRGLLEEIDVHRGFEAIGGLGRIKAYLKRVADNVAAKRLGEVPKGVLLAGPPGTGKTILAEALAQEAKMNLVRMGNIREMWVGQSERNLDRALGLIEDLAPVIVFVDEVDQAMGARVTGGDGGGGGVERRIFARILSVMGDNAYRGKIVWIAATNRPDLLDDAMLRRFDQIIPVLLPGAGERQEIFKAMEQNVEDVAYSPDVDYVQCAEKTAGLSGSAIEIIVRKAAEYATEYATSEEQPPRVKVVHQTNLDRAIENFKPNHNADMYNYQTLLAIQACNFLDMIPPDEAFDDALQSVIQEMRKHKSNLPILQQIARLREALLVQRLL